MLRSMSMAGRPTPRRLPLRFASRREGRCFGGSRSWCFCGLMGASQARSTPRRVASCSAPPIPTGKKESRNTLVVAASGVPWLDMANFIAMKGATFHVNPLRPVEFWSWKHCARRGKSTAAAPPHSQKIGAPVRPQHTHIRKPPKRHRDMIKDSKV